MHSYCTRDTRYRGSRATHMSSFLSWYIETITFLDHLLDFMSVGVCISVAVDKCGNSITEYYRVNRTTCNTVSHLKVVLFIILAVCVVICTFTIFLSPFNLNGFFVTGTSFCSTATPFDNCGIGKHDRPEQSFCCLHFN